MPLCERCKGKAPLVTAKCYWGCDHPVCGECAPYISRWQHA